LNAVLLLQIFSDLFTLSYHLVAVVGSLEDEGAAEDLIFFLKNCNFLVSPLRQLYQDIVIVQSEVATLNIFYGAFLSRHQLPLNPLNSVDLFQNLVHICFGVVQGLCSKEKF
jgi:hypothetical protein